MDTKADKVIEKMDMFNNFVLFLISILIVFSNLLFLYVFTTNWTTDWITPKVILANIVSLATSAYFTTHTVKGLRIGYKEKTSLFKDKEACVKILLGSIMLGLLYLSIPTDPLQMQSDDLALVTMMMGIPPYLVKLLTPLKKKPQETHGNL